MGSIARHAAEISRMWFGRLEVASEHEQSRVRLSAAQAKLGFRAGMIQTRL
jgi:hypothetical protein